MLVFMRKIFSFRLNKIGGYGCPSKRTLSSVRVRFAPSPTGFLHLGGLRTAFYNYLFAKSQNGSFVVRIEDTDQSRLVPGATKKLLEILDWCSLKPDEGPFIGGDYGPYVQSQRISIYKSKVQELLDKGYAYHCFCSEKRLDLIRKEAARLRQIPRYDNRCRHLSAEEVEEKLHEGKPSVLEPAEKPFNDLVYGAIGYDPAENEADPVILKSDGFPTYHLANVVDDHLMAITHVLRGVEWQISTPKHLLLYKAFGWEPPSFAHLPLIVNSDGSKLSKRQGDLHVEHFKAKGYFPEALINFLTSIGGGFGKFEGVQVSDLSKLCDQFQLGNVNVNNCRLELERLESYNQLVLQRKLDEDNKYIVNRVRDLVKKKFHHRLQSLETNCDNHLSDNYIKRILSIFKTRVHNLNEFVQPDFAYVWFSPENLVDSLSKELPKGFVQIICKSLEEIPSDMFVKDAVMKTLRQLSDERGFKFNHLMKFLRMALSGLTVGPSVGEMLEVLGKETALRRIKNFKTVVT